MLQTSEKEMLRKELQGSANADVSGASEEVIYKIDIPANRYDMLCLEGIARALNIFRQRQAPPLFRLADMAGAWRAAGMPQLAGGAARAGGWTAGVLWTRHRLLGTGHHHIMLLVAPHSCPLPPAPMLRAAGKQLQRMVIKPETALVRPFVVCAVLRGVRFDPVRYNSFIDLQASAGEARLLAVHWLWGRPEGLWKAAYVLLQLQEGARYLPAAGWSGPAAAVPLTSCTRSFLPPPPLQDKLHQNVCRQRTLVAIGTHDLAKVQGPFTYEALPPQDIRFVPLKQTQEFDAAGLMQVGRVCVLSGGWRRGHSCCMQGQPRPSRQPANQPRTHDASSQRPEPMAAIPQQVHRPRPHPLQHYLANDQKLKKFVPIIHGSLVYPVIYDAQRRVLR